jgi:hydroxyacyl-ACP dehydratase HTD2-like protein with hotdog domain
MAAVPLHSGELAVPAEIPEFSITPNHTQIFMFSAVTWNRHHIHYNKDAALDEGHEGVVVQRALIGNFLARLLTSWLGAAGEIRELSWKVVRSALPNQSLRCRGTVAHTERTDAGMLLSCEVVVLNPEDQPIATGQATVLLAAGASLIAGVSP